MKTCLPSVLLLSNRPGHATAGDGLESEAGVLDEVRAVASALERSGLTCACADAATLDELPAVLAAHPDAVVFNLIEGFQRHPEQAALAPAVCEAHGRGCTGNDAACQALALDKWRAKAVLRAAGLPVPDARLVPPGGRLTPRDTPRLPVIVKPAATDASEGIHADSVIRRPGRALAAAIARVHHRFQQPALVESFVGERELNVSVIQRGRRVDVLPIAEIEFRGFGPTRPQIVDYAAKWDTASFEYRNTVRVIPARLPARVAAETRRLARAAWDALGCRDYARVDFRLGADGKLFILEVNPNPDIGPESGFAAALRAARIPFTAFVRSQVANAAARRAAASPQLPTIRIMAPDPRDLASRVNMIGGKRDRFSPIVRSCRTRRQGTKAMIRNVTLRHTVAADRSRVLKLVEATGFFRADEIQTAAEVLDDAIKDGSGGHYQSFTLLDDGCPVGWICWGLTPCTVGTYDIYWIAVAPECHGRGFGRRLIEHAEAGMRALRGRLSVLETSGRPQYESTRGFYLKLGYTEGARLREFYDVADDKVVYLKNLG
ncbi:MAG: GNAT family N-acetyltransferase [bacterium]